MSGLDDIRGSDKTKTEAVKLRDITTANRVFDGYSDSELESLVETSPFNKGLSPWAYWTSELYSFGRLYREWGYFPRLLPLYVYSDHGIHRIAQLDAHEVNNDAKVHFTFNPKRFVGTSGKTKKEIICVPHPWVTYRRRKNIVPSKDAKGTLVFFSHSNEGVTIIGHDTDEYFEKLRNLPDKYHPIVLCMHMHDVQKGHHKGIRKHNFPIVTAGNTSSVKFVDNFYSIVRNFKYTSGSSSGSQLCYCVEMGIPYFFLGDIPLVRNDSCPENSFEIQKMSGVQREIFEIERNLFSQPVDQVSLQQKIFIEWMLGLTSNVTRIEASLILWREFFRNWSKWHLSFKLVFTALRRHRPVVFIKKLLRYLKGGMP
jgi:hypothetical protein